MVVFEFVCDKGIVVKVGGKTIGTLESEKYANIMISVLDEVLPSEEECTASQTLAWTSLHAAFGDLIRDM